MKAVLDLTLSLPSIEKLDLPLEYGEKENYHLSDRATFATAFSASTFPSLQEANLEYWEDEPGNQNTKPRNLIGTQDYDLLSSAIF